MCAGAGSAASWRPFAATSPFVSMCGHSFRVPSVHFLVEVCESHQPWAARQPFPMWGGMGSPSLLTVAWSLSCRVLTRSFHPPALFLPHNSMAPRGTAHSFTCVWGLLPRLQ